MTTLIILFSAILLGALLHRVKLPQLPDRLLSVVVWLLLFLFGLAIGMDDSVFGRLHEFGLTALVLAVAGTVGSVLAARLLSRRKS